MCHARDPAWEGIGTAPKGVLLETEADIARHARTIYTQSGLTNAMPPPSASFMQPEDRAAIVAWFRAGRG
jgi:uncharacterized membrane protein